MTGFIQDLRYATRGLQKAPMFTSVAVLTLAIGIGAITAIYMVLERVVLDPLPYPNPERLVRLKSQVPGVRVGEEWQLSAGEYFYFRDHAQTLEDVAAFQRSSATIQTPAGPRSARLSIITANTLRLLGANAELGRLIDAHDDRPGAPLVAVISATFWQREFGEQPDVVGRVLQIGGQPAEIVGVVSSDVDLPEEPGTGHTDLWIPMRLNEEGPFYNSHVIPMFALLRPGSTVTDAQTELDRLTARLPEVLPKVYSARFFERYGFRTAVYPLKLYVVGEVGRNLWMLFGAVGLVLLIACANVSNLFLVRVEARRRELAIRTALGASRGANTRLFAAESLALAMVGACLALVFGSWGVDWLVSLAPPTIPRLESVAVDGSIVVFTLGVGLLVSVSLVGFSVMRQQGIRPTVLVEGGRSVTEGHDPQRFRKVLVVAQVALALVLIVAATLLVESFHQLRSVNRGINPDGVLTVEVSASGAQYDTDDKIWRFYSGVLDRIRALPGVIDAGASMSLPFTGQFGCTVQGFEDSRVYDRLEKSDLTSCAGQVPTTPGYFEAMGIAVLRGRAFTASDNDNPNVGAVIVSKAFAERFWPGEDPIGKGVGPNGYTKQQFYRVVGVVGDVFSSSVTEEPAVVIYYPVRRIPNTGGWSLGAAPMRLAIRTTLSNPTSLFPNLQRAVREADPTIPLANAEEMQTIVDRSMSRTSFVMTLLGIAASVALLLAAIGLYGVISYIAARRTHEVGVRLALGAEPQEILRLMLSGALTLVSIGLVLGIFGALAFARLLRGLLFGVEPTHVLAYGTAALLLAIVSLLATWIPARRAARMDPLVALRYE
jgi:predicted permease